LAVFTQWSEQQRRPAPQRGEQAAPASAGPPLPPLLEPAPLELLAPELLVPELPELPLLAPELPELPLLAPELLPLELPEPLPPELPFDPELVPPEPLPLDPPFGPSSSPRASVEASSVPDRNVPPPQFAEAIATPNDTKAK
jgi:hypothetical protein